MKLRKTMCGSLDAGQRLGEHYAQVLEAGGFPEAWLLRATSSMKACKTTFWCTVTVFFHSGPT